MEDHKGTLFIISAASGVGKTSLVKTIINKLDNIMLSISHTTRVKRPKEQDGLDYFFVSTEQFLNMENTKEFLETAKIFDNYYGTSKQFVINTLKQGIDVILEIDYQGTKQIKQQFDKSDVNCLSIFILPPSLKVLSERLKKRKQDDYNIIKKRLNNAKKEMLNYSHYEYLIINDDFNKAVQDISNIISAERLTVSKQQCVHAQLINNLLT